MKAAKRSAGLDDDESPVLAGLHVPRPVFFCSVEPASSGVQLRLDAALAALTREDPSVRVTTDPDSGQTVIGGMGELHLQVTRGTRAGARAGPENLGCV